MEFNRLSE